MAFPKHIKSVDPEPLEPETIDIEPLSDDGWPAGRIVHDARGNAVWKWRGETSSTEDTASGVLKYIDPTDLEVKGQGGASGPISPKSNVPADAGGGYDPYNQGGVRTKTPAPVKSGRGKG